MQKEQGMYVLGFIDNRNNYTSNLPEQAEGNLNFKVNLIYKSPDGKNEFSLFVVLSRYMTDGKWFSVISFTSNEATYVSADYMYKKIIYSAIAHSTLKGSYFVMPYNELGWESKNLEVRGFEDVYLPDKIMQDLKLFTGLFEKRGQIMRYLLAGTPGTGKTESTIAIANILKKKGVTIIKTVVDDLLKEKIELAELLSPSLIIFDDLDLYLGSRSKGGFSRSLSTFLDVMDGTDKISKGVGIIATSNSIELLDQAARRPGRFDKLMSFDEITKDNIKNIVLKSLKYENEIGKTHPISKILLDNKVIDFLLESKQTGSWVYNIVDMVMRKIDILEIKNVDVDWVIGEFEQEIKTIKTITNARYLEDGELKGKDNSKRIGLLPSGEDEEIYDDEEYPGIYPKEVEPSYSDGYFGDEVREGE